jgi:hypothetical protein
VAGAGLSLMPVQGPVKTQAVLKGHGFPANTSVSLIWGTQVGSRVSGNGFAPKEQPLATLTVAADGRLEAPLVIPDDLGGNAHAVHQVRGQDAPHVLRDRNQCREHLADVRSRGDAGDDPSEGVGWTDVDNIYVATYDNAYMGYACGFNSQGDVVINFTRRAQWARI